MASAVNALKLLFICSLNCPREQLSDYDCDIWKVDMHCDCFLWVFNSKPPCWQEERRAEHMKMWCGETGLLKAIAIENSITELDDLISSPLLLITLLFKVGLIAGYIGFLIMSRHLGELSLSSCFEMIPSPSPPVKKSLFPRLINTPWWLALNGSLFRKWTVNPLPWYWFSLGSAIKLSEERLPGARYCQTCWAQPGLLRAVCSLTSAHQCAGTKAEQVGCRDKSQVQALVTMQIKASWWPWARGCPVVSLREAMEGERQSKMNEILGQWNYSVHTNAWCLAN